MNNLEKALAEHEHPDARRARATHPKGFEPGVTFNVETGMPDSAVVSSPVRFQDATDHRAQIVAQTGLDIPDHLDVALERLTFQQGPNGDAERWWFKYRFVTRIETARIDPVDHVATLKQIRRDRSKKKATLVGESAYCLSWNDWQAGKTAGGGTAALLDRYGTQVDQSKHRIKELRKVGRDLGQLVIIGGGDMVEGCTIYPNQPFELDLDGRRRQINVTTDMILYGLDELAPMFDRVTVVAVGGNHGENRINGNRTSRHDNDDVLVFENAARAVSRDARLEHVNFVLAQDEPAKSIDVCGWIYATTHGQAFGKGAGRPEQKAHNWFKGQAAGRQPAGDADVLVSHHYHHMSMRDWGACLWVQTPANDGGSPQHTDLTGECADSGMLSWVVTPATRFQDAQILTGRE